MSRSCAIITCKRASRALCQCCEQCFCREHFIEHDDELNLGLNPLIDHINTLADRLNGFNINKLIDCSLEKLSKWRDDSHRAIEHYYEQKCQELDEFVAKIFKQQRDEIGKIRFQITELIDKQETTHDDIKSLTSSIDILKQKMNEIEQLSIKVNISPYLINKEFINFTQSNPRPLNLLTLPSAYSTILRSDKSSTALVSNDQYLLIHRNSKLCLIDNEFSIIKEKEWFYDSIIHMCWSSTLNSFIIITAFDVFLVHGDLISIKRIETIEGRLWQSCACSDDSLYLSTGIWDSSIREFSITPSIKFIRHWKIAQKQRIDNIVYNNKTLALTITNQFNKTKFIELRSTDTFDCLWSCQLNIDYSETVIRCCLLSYNEWLVIDWKTSKLVHISNNGKVKESYIYKCEPLFINFFHSNILVISTNKNINFHKL